MLEVNYGSVTRVAEEVAWMRHFRISPETDYDGKLVCKFAPGLEVVECGRGCAIEIGSPSRRNRLLPFLGFPEDRVQPGKDLLYGAMYDYQRDALIPDLTPRPEALVLVTGCGLRGGDNKSILIDKARTAWASWGFDYLVEMSPGALIRVEVKTHTGYPEFCIRYDGARLRRVDRPHGFEGQTLRYYILR